MEHQRTIPLGVVLISEDAALTRTLSADLERRKLSLRAASGHRTARSLLREATPELILLDLEDLPEPASVVASVRELSTAPIVLLIPDGFDAQMRFEALLAGAGDYAAKPIRFDELSARIEATLKRTLTKPRDTIDYADLTVTLSRRRVERGGEAIELSSREFDLLTTFVRHPQRVYSRAQLRDLIWGAKRSIGFNAVERHVSNLRAKLDRPPRRRLIQTIVGIGYALR